jgi:ATP-dependent Lhr-like helicase
MGIDIGTVHSVAQVGPPPSVAALRQRLGRSGRRGEPAILRIYVTEPAVDPRTSLPDQLRAGLVQSIAALHPSTLIQQVMSAIAQHGGVTAEAAYRALCGPGSAFTAITQAQFAALLRGLGANDVLVQSDDSTLLLGQAGERTVNHYSFYAAFTSPEQYRLLMSGRPLGTVPADQALYAGPLPIFGGRRWKVTAVDHVQKIIEVTGAAGGRPPRFDGGHGAVHDQVRARMRSVLAAGPVPRYLSTAAVSLLSEARAAYARYKLAEHMTVRDGADTVLFPWAGSRVTARATVHDPSTGNRVATGHVVHQHAAALSHAGKLRTTYRSERFARSVQNSHSRASPRGGWRRSDCDHIGGYWSGVIDVGYGNVSRTVVLSQSRAGHLLRELPASRLLAAGAPGLAGPSQPRPSADAADR